MSFLLERPMQVPLSRGSGIRRHQCLPRGLGPRGLGLSADCLLRISGRFTAYFRDIFLIGLEALVQNFPLKRAEGRLQPVSEL